MQLLGSFSDAVVLCLEWQVLQLSSLLLSVIFTPTSEALTVVSGGNL